MARIIVPRADSSVWAAPSVAPFEEVKPTLKGTGREGMGTLAAGVGLADAVAKSPAIGALLAGLSRLGSNIEGAGDEALRQEAAQKLMERQAGLAKRDTTPFPAIPKDVVGAAALTGEGAAPLVEPMAPKEPGSLKAAPVMAGMGKVALGPAPADRAAPALRGPVAGEMDEGVTTGALGEVANPPALRPMRAAQPQAPAKSKLARTTDPAKLLAMASKAGTKEEQEAILDMAADADVYGANLLEIATGAHKRRFAQELVKAFPKAPSQMDLYKMANIKSSIVTRAQQVKLAQDKATRDAEQFAERMRQQAEMLDKRLRAAARQGAATRANQRTLQKMREDAAEAAREAAAAERVAGEERKKLAKVNEAIGGYEGQEGPLPEETALMDAKARVEAVQAQAKASAEDPTIAPPSEAEVKNANRGLAKAQAAAAKAKAEMAKRRSKFLGDIAPLFPGAGAGSSVSDIMDVGGQVFGDED